MNFEQAVVALAGRSAEAAGDVLEGLAGSSVETSAPVVVETLAEPLESLYRPTVIATASYLDDASGGHLLAVGPGAAKRLAATVIGTDLGAGELSEIALSALGEAGSQMLAAAAQATASALGQPVELGPVETRMLSGRDELPEVHHPGSHLTSVAFELDGEPCRLLQQIPQSFVIRLTSALTPAPEAAASGSPLTGEVEWLRETRLRLTAEIGRARLPAGRVTALGEGAIVSLDRHADDPIELYVNGSPFASGRLMLLPDGDWAVRIEDVGGSATQR